MFYIPNQLKKFSAPKRVMSFAVMTKLTWKIIGATTDFVADWMRVMGTLKPKNSTVNRIAISNGDEERTISSKLP
jgi:hypothetical protein